MAYARDLDSQQFYIIKRKNKFYPSSKKNFTNNEEETNDKAYKTNYYSKMVWKLSFLGKYLNLTDHQFYHTKALMFLKDEKYEFKLIHLFLR